MSMTDKKTYKSEFDAWNWIHEMFPGTQWYLDHESSERAGYRTYRDTEEFYNYVCELGDRLEVNLKEGNSTINLWIEDDSDNGSIAEDTKTYKLSNREVDIICNRLYTVISALASDDVGKCSYNHTKMIVEDINLIHKLRDIREGKMDDTKREVCQHIK